MEYQAINITMDPDGCAYVRCFVKIDGCVVEIMSKIIDSSEELQQWQLAQLNMYQKGGNSTPVQIETYETFQELQQRIYELKETVAYLEYEVDYEREYSGLPPKYTKKEGYYA